MSPPYCKFKDCSHSKKYNDCKFHKFPADRARCERWLRASKWSASPTKIPAAVFLCSCHFFEKRGPTDKHPDPLEDLEEAEGEEEVDDVDVLTDGGTNLGSEGRSDFTEEHEEAQLEAQLQDVVMAGDISGTNHEGLCDFAEEHEQVEPSLTANAGTEWEEPSLSSLALADSDQRFREPEVRSNATEPSKPSVANEDEILAMPIPNDMSVSFDESTREVNPISSTDADVTEGSEPMRKRWRTSKERGEVHDVPLCDDGVQCNRPPFSFDYCVKRLFTEPDDFHYYTGISPEAFDVLYEFLGGDEVCAKLKYNFAPKTPTRERFSEHTPKDKLFITLFRLRRGLTLRDLKLCFGLSEKTLSTIFYTWIRHMSLQFKCIEKEIFISAEKQAENPPDCFKPFPNLRAVLDCAEFFIQTPENLAQQSNTYSSYKGRTTVKVLFGASTFGGLVFVSEAVEGSMSDRKLFLKSCLMDLLNPGEAIMCDKGFDIEADLEAIGVELLIPAYLGRRSHFTARELLINKAIAGSRIHVEILIKKVKDFRLIRHTIPNSLLDIVPDIIRVCANLVNFGPSHIVWAHE